MRTIRAGMHLVPVLLASNSRCTPVCYLYSYVPCRLARRLLPLRRLHNIL